VAGAIPVALSVEALSAQIAVMDCGARRDSSAAARCAIDSLRLRLASDI
jgi:hypothetical protein